MYDVNTLIAGGELRAGREDSGVRLSRRQVERARQPDRRRESLRRSARRATARRLIVEHRIALGRVRADVPGLRTRLS